jgi:Fibronectin type III domain
MTSSKSKPVARVLTWGAVAGVVVASTMVGLSYANAAGTPPWTNVQTLSTSDTRSYDPVSIAVTPDGSKQIVLWENNDGGVRTVKSASATLTGGVALWGPTATVATLTDDSSRPNIALSWDGTRATAVWQDVSGTNQLIKSASATISGTTQTWGSAFDVYTSASNGLAEVPKVALSAGGDLAVVTWYATITDQFQILARAAGISGTTQNWEASHQILTGFLPSGWNAYRPAIDMNDDASKATVAYYAANYALTPNEGGVYSNSATITPGTSPNFIPTVSWGSQGIVNIPGSGGVADDVDLALSNGGLTAIATWTAYGSPASVRANIATISGNTATWGGSGGFTLSDPGDSAGASQVAISSDGSRATAVWSQQTGSNTYVARARSATISGTTGTWGVATDLSAASGSANSPDVAVSSNGQLATAVWAYASGSNSVNVIQASNAYLNSGTMSWSSRVDLSASSATPAPDPSDPYGGFTPQLGLSSDGLVASTVWGWQSGTSFSVQTVKANGTCTQSWDGSTQCLPGSPTSVSVTSGDLSASLSWTAPADPYGYGITGYAYLLMDPSNNSVVRSWTTTGSTATSTTISGLTNGMTYVAYIATINAFGQGSSAATSPLFTPSAAPAPGPGPQPSQAATTPTQQIPATPAIPVASPSTSTAVAGVPDNPPVGQVVTPGLRLVSAEVADSAQPRLVKRDLGSTLKEAPVVDAVTRVPVSLVTQGLSSNTLYQVRVKVGKTYVDLGGAVTDTNGVAQLPVFQSARAGTMTIALVDPLTGSTTYLKVRFTRDA